VKRKRETGAENVSSKSAKDLGVGSTGKSLNATRKVQEGDACQKSNASRRSRDQTPSDVEPGYLESDENRSRGSIKLKWESAAENVSAKDATHRRVERMASASLNGDTDGISAVQHVRTELRSHVMLNLVTQNLTALPMALGLLNVQRTPFLWQRQFEVVSRQL